MGGYPVICLVLRNYNIEIVFSNTDQRSKFIYELSVKFAKNPDFFFKHGIQCFDDGEFPIPVDGIYYQECSSFIENFYEKYIGYLRQRRMKS
jgi:hypothetical protein